MRSNHKAMPLKTRAGALVTGIALVCSTSVFTPQVLADTIDELKQEVDAANSRAEAANKDRQEAANRAENAEASAAASNAEAEATQAELEAATARLDELFREVEIAMAELGQARYDLSMVREEIADIENQIEQATKKLERKQKSLDAQVSTSYKLGRNYWLEVVLDSVTFDEFLSRIVYANSVTEEFTNTVNEVKDLRAQLQAYREELAVKEAEQEELVELCEERKEIAEAAEAAQQEFVDGLSDELMAAIEAARAAEAESAQARAEEAMYAAQENEARAEAAEQQRKLDAEIEAERQRKLEEERQRRLEEERQRRLEEERQRQSEAEAAAAAATALSERTYSYTAEVAPYVESVATGDQRETAVNAALSQVGLPYIWGTEAPGVGFDCNSLTHWAWSVAGVDIPYASGHYSYGQFQWLKASGHWVYDVSDLQLGDLVFYSYNGGYSTYHVAMYIGGGMVVQAHSYTLGVTVTDIYAVSGFCGGGSPI